MIDMPLLNRGGRDQVKLVALTAHVTYDLPGGGDRILHSVAQATYAGTLTALLGPSGAGKSTLLDIIAGRRKGGKVKGEVSAIFSDQSTVDLRQPEAVNHPAHGFGQLASYVQQDDCLVSNLTVQETLEFALRLRKRRGKPVWPCALHCTRGTLTWKC